MSINLSSLLCCNNGGKWEHVVQFNSDGTWTKPADVGVVRIIAIGGGGGGGASRLTLQNNGGYVDVDIGYRAVAGGGGAGQLIDMIAGVTGDINITIGQGGLGGNQSRIFPNTNSRIDGVPGENTTLSGGVNLIAHGGGGGKGTSIEGPRYNTPSYTITGYGAVGGHVKDSGADVPSLYPGYSGGSFSGGSRIWHGVPGASCVYAVDFDYNQSTAMEIDIKEARPADQIPVYGPYPRFNDALSYEATLYAPGGVYGIGGGGAGAGGRILPAPSYPYTHWEREAIPQGIDGAGHGGAFTMFDKDDVEDGSGNPLPIPTSFVDGGDATSNTGAGGGAGGLAVNYQSSLTPKTPVYFGRGGNGGSGTVIIMW